MEIETGLDLPKQAEEDDEFADQGPNQLHVVVIQAKNLPIMDKNLFSSGGSSDPVVRLKIQEEATKITKVKEKDLNPVYNETFVWDHLEDSSKCIELTVDDVDSLGVVKNYTFMVCFFCMFVCLYVCI